MICTNASGLGYKHKELELFILEKENDNAGITEAQSHVSGMLKHPRHIIYTAYCVQVKSQQCPYTRQH